MSRVRHVLGWELVGALLLASSVSAQVSPSSMAGRSTVYAPNAAVATSQPLASGAGLEILQQGGNAVDAAVAAAAVLNLTEPHMTGIGGDMFAILWSANDQELVGLDASGRSGSLLTPETLRAKGHERMPGSGAEAVTVPGAISAPSGMLDTRDVMHPFTGIQITDKGAQVLAEYVAAVREVVGYEIPLAADHFGHIGIESCIRLARALEPCCLAWLEDMVPWQFTDQYVRLSRSCSSPICTGEDIYLKEGFLPLFRKRAIAVAHPDLATSGGILETKKIGDLAQEHGIAMAMHMAATPVATMASVHCAAATENFLVLEDHAVDNPDWDRLVMGLPNPIVQDGFIHVPQAPGLGIDLDPEEVARHIDPGRPGCFESTSDWDHTRTNDRLWS